jgi:cytochrome c6
MALGAGNRLAWMAALVAAAAPGALAQAPDAGRQLFLAGATPPCVECHTLKDADAMGYVGPSLDELKPDAKRVVNALKNGKDLMKPYPALTDAQIEAIARYVESASRLN